MLSIVLMTLGKSSSRHCLRCPRR